MTSGYPKQVEQKKVSNYLNTVVVRERPINNIEMKNEYLRTSKIKSVLDEERIGKLMPISEFNKKREINQPPFARKTLELKSGDIPVNVLIE